MDFLHYKNNASNRDVISLFSGAMGLDIGLAKAGLNIVIGQDFDPACVATMRANGHKVLGGDIREIDAADLLEQVGLAQGEPFLICGGPPCQPFSTAGKRLGINDPRGSLFMDFIRMIDYIRPRFFIMENVKGIISAPLKHTPLAERDKNDPEQHLGTVLDVILSEFNKLGYKTADDLYVGIGVGGVSTMQVVNRMRDEFKSQLAELEAQDDEKALENQLNAKSNRRSGKKNIGGISIQGMGDVDVKFANCCKPVPGDPIVGYITRGSGITVHHRECKNIQSLSDKDRARLIDVNWEGFENSVYEVQIFVEALDRPKITPDVMALINDSHVHIASITSRVKEHMALMEITAEVSDLQELNVVMEKINAIPDVFSVRRD